MELKPEANDIDRKKWCYTVARMDSTKAKKNIKR